MPRAATVRIPTPCSESWAAMTPTGDGRHCATCQKVVVDFTQKTDAEILAYLRQLGQRETCGRFANDQLNRPLLPAAASRPASRWRAGLAMAFALWGLRASPAAASAAPPASAGTTHPYQKPGPTPHPARTAPKLLHGTVRDAATHEPLAGVAIFLKGENRSATTDSAGHFSLRLPAGPPRAGRALVVHFTGYQSKTLPLPASGSNAVPIELRADPAAAGAEVVGYGSQTVTSITGGMVVVDMRDVRPAPASRSFWRWLTQPFRH